MEVRGNFTLRYFISQNPLHPPSRCLTVMKLELPQSSGRGGKEIQPPPGIEPDHPALHGHAIG
jgi:hypothetical protein